VIFSGPIFTALRTQSLAFFPNEVNVGYARGISFEDWTSSGAYGIERSDANLLVLRSSPIEFSSIFLRDIEYLLNHCFEQFVEIQRLSVDHEVRSDAWGVVTIYYYAYFAAQLLLRLLGNPVMYLDADIMRLFRQLAAPNRTPGGGSFRITLVQTTGPSEAHYELRKLDARSHNAVWAALFGIIRHHLSITKQSSSISSEEEIFYGGLCSNVAHRFYVNDEWPARIRHKANYVPGFCYSLIEGNVLAKGKKMLESWKGEKIENFHNLVDAPVRKFKNCNFDNFEDHVKLLSDVGHGIFSLARHLYLDIYGRRNFDKRWENRRIAFLRKHATLDDYHALFLND